MNIRKTKQTDTQVNDKSYVMTQYTATTGLKYLKKIQKLLVPVWTEVISNGGQITPEVITMASEKFYEMDEADIKSMICDALAITPQVYDLDFAGKYFSIFEMVKEIIMFNYEEVFTKLGLEEI